MDGWTSEETAIEFVTLAILEFYMYILIKHNRLQVLLVSKIISTT